MLTIKTIIIFLGFKAQPLVTIIDLFGQQVTNQYKEIIISESGDYLPISSLPDNNLYIFSHKQVCFKLLCYFIL